MSSPPELPAVQKQVACMYAFATVEGGTPRVFRFSTDKNGLESLANLIRSERVLSVVQGVELPVSRKDVVDIGLGGNEWTSTLDLEA